MVNERVLTCLFCSAWLLNVNKHNSAIHIENIFYINVIIVLMSNLILLFYNSVHCPARIRYLYIVNRVLLKIIYRMQRFIISFKFTINNTIVYPMLGWPSLDHCPTPGFVSCPAFLFATFRLIFHLTVLYFFYFHFADTLFLLKSLNEFRI